MLAGVLSDNLCNLEVRKCEIFKTIAVGVNRKVYSDNVADTNLYFNFKTVVY